MAKKKTVSIFDSGRLVYQYAAIKPDGQGHYHILPEELVIADWDHGAAPAKMTLELLPKKKKVDPKICPHCKARRHSSQDADVYVCPNCHKPAGRKKS